MNKTNSDIKNIFYKYKWSYAFLLFCILLISISSVIPTLIIKKLTDTPNLIFKDFVFFSIVILVTGIISFIFSVIFKYKYTNVSISAIEDFVRLLMKKILYSKWENISKTKIGDLFSVFEKDSTNAASNISYILTVFLLEVVKIISMLSVLFYLNTYFASISILLIPILYFIVKYSKKSLTKAITKRREAHAKIEVVKSDILLGISTVKLFNLEEYKLNKLNTNIEDFIFWVSKHRLFESFTNNTSSLLSSFLSVFVFLLGGYYYISDQMSIGTLIASYTAILQLYSPIQSLFSMSLNINEVKVSLDRLRKYLEFEPEENIPDNIEFKNKHVLEFNKVSISFDATKILDNISFKINSPGIYAIIGKSGTGKSTIVNILSKLYNNYDGTIYVDGLSLNKIPHKIIRDKLSVVSQESFLFNDTILNNLKLGDLSLSDNDVIKFCEENNIDNFINMFPQGYETLIGEGNHPLSRGEKQRITFIRALLRNPEIIVLDEATNSIDAENERFYYNLIKQIGNKCIVLIIAHDLWKVKECKEIFVIKDKMIFEHGDHEKLLSNKGEYYSLFNIQKNY